MRFDLAKFMSKLDPIDLDVSIPAPEFESRIERTRAMLQERSIDVGFACGNELKPGDVGWLTGYDPHLEDTACIVGRKKVFVLGGPEGAAYANELKKAGDFRNLDALKIPEEDYPGAVFHSMADLLEEANGGKVGTIGLLSPESYLPVSLLRLLEEYGAATKDASDFLLKSRYIKSAAEQRIIRIAAIISTHAMRAMASSVHAGVRETEVAAIGDYVMRALGADGRPGVSTLVNSGSRISNVIGRASNKEICAGDMVLLGLSARFQGLASSVSRTVVAGEESPDQKELLDRSADAYRAAEKRIVFGKTASGPDIAARESLKAHGLSPMYSVVHNIGWTEAMEGFGAATQYSDYPFPRNITIMLDIGIFGTAFRGLVPSMVGMRMEDPFLINNEGETEKLADLPVRL
jgi:Xaa-Pro aminopeptidase